jgi:hypothetical protein
MVHLLSRGVVFVYFLLIISTSICGNQHDKDCKQLILATWNIGLEEQQATQRVPFIINAILNSDANIITLQEVWGGPQILRTIYQAVKSKYPNFEVVNDNMRNYISADQIPNQVYPPACPALAILNFEICFFPKCSNYTGTLQFICATTQCPTQFVTLYRNSVCWACLFDRFLSQKDPLGLNYCGAVNLPQYYSISPGITPNSTEAPWNNSIGLLILSDVKHPLQKVEAAVFSEIYVLIRGYIIVTTYDGKLILSNSHIASVEAIPHPLAGTFFNNTYGSWEAENLGQITELQSNVWGVFQSQHGDKEGKSVVMLGDFNMGIANFAHNVSNIIPESWYYIHGINDSHGQPRWYDDYTEKQSLCTGCSDNLVVPYPPQYIFDHIFTHGPLFSSSLFTKRTFDDYVPIIYNNMNVTTSLSDHDGIEMIIIH